MAGIGITIGLTAGALVIWQLGRRGQDTAPHAPQAAQPAHEAHEAHETRTQTRPVQHGAHAPHAGHAGHEPECDPRTARAAPLLSVADFDGDGVVDEADIALVMAQVKSREYVALFDRDADGRLDTKDVLASKRDLGKKSTTLDRQIASAYQATHRFRDQRVALAAGYIPATPAFAGHGVHYVQPVQYGTLDYDFAAAAPEGLNYDADGRLWAVFYYVGLPGTDLSKFDPAASAPAGFATDQDHWHHHAGACFLGLDYKAPVLNHERLESTQCVGPGECAELARRRGYSSHLWNPKFFMVHLWLYRLNPCGAFANTHPELMPEAPPLPHGICDITDRVDRSGDGRDDEYPLSPYPTLCRWYAQIDVAAPELGCVRAPVLPRDEAPPAPLPAHRH